MKASGTPSRTRVVRFALVALFAASGATVSAEQRPENPAEGFRQFPGGQAIPNLRADLSPGLAAAALRVDADRQLPEGFRVRNDGEPVVVAVGSNRIFRFGLEYDGVRVATADYVAIVGRDGRLLASRFRRIPRSVDATVPTVAPAAARAAAAAHARGTLGQAGTLSATDTVLEIWVDDQQRGRLCWSLTLREKSAGSVRSVTRYRVAAIEMPVVRSWTDLIRYESTIHVQADAWPLSPNQPTVVTPLPGARVFAAGQVGVTGADGNVTFPAIAPGSSLQTDLRGPFALVRTASGTGGPLTVSATATGGDDTLHFAGTTEFALAQTTGFAWATLGNRWVRQFLPFLDTTPTPLDAIDVFVNENIPCNAFSTGDTIHFGRATSACNNTAAPTIILHEFGHSLHAVLTDSFEAAYSEGFGDALAMLVTEQPCVGLGAFRGSEACMRDATDVTLWPVSSTDPHQIGEPYGQFVWAMAGGLGFERAAEIVMGSAAAAPDDIPDAVRLSFVAADDDGLLGTCSPDQKVLEAAADSRLLPRPPDCRPAGDNQPPTASDDAFSFVEDEEEREIDLLGNDTDPDGDPLQLSDIQPPVLGRLDCSPMPCRYRPRPDANGTESLTYTVIDTYGGQATATVHIQIAPVEDVPSVSGRGDIAGLEDAPAPVSVSVVDPDGPAFTWQWFAGTTGSPAPCTFAEPSAASTTMMCTREGSFPFGVVVTQAGTELVAVLGTAEIANTRPSVAITTPAAGASFPEQSSVEVVAPFDEGPASGPHACEISWGDGAVTDGAVADGTCTGSHVYAPGAAGDREILVSVRDSGFARGRASVSIRITRNGPAPCRPPGGQRCTVSGFGSLDGLQPVTFEFNARLRGRRATGHMLLLEQSWRFVTFTVRRLTITGDGAVFSGAGSLDGQRGHTFEATIADKRPPDELNGPPFDTMRVVIRDGAGAVVRVIEAQVTSGDIAIP